MDDRLRKIARRVAEDQVIDWTSVEREVASEDERRVIEGLRIVTKVVAVHRRSSKDLSESVTSPTPTEKEVQPLPDRWGDLVVRRPLGQGGYGEVFLAYDPSLDREIALKLYHGNETGEGGVSVTQEGRLLARIKHPNVVTVHGADEREGRSGIWMELIRGKTLAQLVSEQGPFAPSVAALVGIDLCRALAAVHAHMLHRDIKAQNVMREEGGRIVLMDFGIGTLATEEAPELRGTPAYVAPELFDGEPPSVRSDLYSLGVLLYHLVTNALPVPGDTVGELAEAHRNSRRVFLRDRRPDLPDAFVTAVEKSLAPDPAARYASAGEMELALTAATGIEARAEQPPTADDRTPTRKRPWHHELVREPRPSGLGLALAAVVVLVLGIALIRVFLPPPEPPEATTPGTPSLAVLPIENLTGDPANDFLAAGITDILTSRLASLPGFLIVPRSIVLELGGAGLRRSQNPAVSHFVEGSLQRAGSGLRLSLRLTAARESAVVWSEVYDGRADDFFELQGRAVGRVVQRVGQMRLPPPELATLSARLAEPPTLDMEAFSLYSEARLRLDRYDTPGNLERAIDGFEAALEHDPGFALAHAGLGEACWRMFDRTRDEVWIGRARDAALEGLRLDPNEPSVRFTLATVYEFTGRREQALEELERVLELQPASPRALRLLGRIQARLGDAGLSRAYFDRAIALGPNDPSNYAELGLSLFRLGRYREAAEAFETLVLLEPRNPSAHQRLGTAYHAMGELEEARRHYEDVLALAPSASTYSNLGAIHFSEGRYREAADAYVESLELDPSSAQTMRNLGEAYDALGEHDLSRDAYERVLSLTAAELEVNPNNAFMLSLQALAEARLGRPGAALSKAERASALDPESHDVLYHRAAVHALGGRRDEALEYLRMAVASGYPTTHIADDPDWAELRNDPEFQSIVMK